MARLLGGTHVSEPVPTRYLSANGSNSNNGLTAGAPWLTFQHAAANAPSASEVHVLDEGGPFANFTWTNLTSRSSRTTFKPYPGDSPQLAGFTIGSGATRVNYVGFEDLTFIAAANLRGTGVRYTNCPFAIDPAAPFGHALTIQDGSDDVIVDGCEFTGAKAEFAINYSSDSVAQGGSSTEPQISNTILRNNVITGVTAGGFRITNFVNCTVEDNTITGITRAGISSHTDVIRTFRGGTNLICRRNYMDNNNALGIFIKDGVVTGATFTDNVVLRCAGSFQELLFYDVTGLDLVNNTTDGSISFGSAGDLANISSLRMFNNISATLTKDGTATETFRNYNYHGTYTGLSAAANDILVTPTFVDTGAQNYRLASGSSAVNAGVSSGGGLSATSTDLDGNTRPFGAAPDLGAYERQS